MTDRRKPREEVRVLPSDLGTADVDGDVDGNRYRLFVEHAADAFFLHDELGVVIDCNEESCRSLGYDRDELIGKTPPDFNTHITPTEIESVRSRLAAGEIVSFDSRHRRKDGSDFPVEIRLRMFESSGRHYFLSFVRDISERVRAAERVDDLQNRLAHANRYQSMGEIAAAIAHELSQPLSAIRLNVGTAQAIAEKLGNPNLNECLRQIDAQTLRTSEIVRRTRAFVCRDRSLRTRCDVNGLIKEVLSLLSHYLHQNAAQVDASGPEAPALVDADAIQIQQVLVNLIRNAVDAAAATGDDRRRIAVRTDVLDGVVRVSVSDTGCGVYPSVVENLFSPFTTTKPTGMGMGLSICRTIIEDHGGQIRYEPNQPRGATFSFVLPATS